MDTRFPLSENLDRLVIWDNPTPMQSGFFSGLDMQTRTVRVMGSGIWRYDDAQRYFDEQTVIVTEARRRFDCLKVFFDVRDWIIEGPQSALQFQDMNSEIYRQEDRLVAVVKSSISKRHPRMALGEGNRESFVSISAAETWLQAYSSSR